MEPVQVLRPDLVLVDWGPMTLSISAWLQGRPHPLAAAQAARAALHALAQLSDFQNLLRRPVSRLPKLRRLPVVVARAVEAASAVGGDLTPLAAVAGAAADEVADQALAQGADRVVVNNGGDIALRIPDRTRVGLKQPSPPDQPCNPLLAVLELPAASHIGGVASSGWQGRSLSPGVAELVTCWASSAALADAAATWVAGAARVDSPAVHQVPARQVDPASDLGEMLVTRQVDPLSLEHRLIALEGAMARARELHGRGLLAGCLIKVQDETAVLDPAGYLRWAGEEAEEETLVELV